MCPSGKVRLVIGGSPYTVLYRVRGTRIMIGTVWHTAQNQVSGSARKFKNRQVPRVPVLRLGPPNHLLGWTTTTHFPVILIPLILGCANSFALRWLTTPPMRLCRHIIVAKTGGVNW